MKTRVLAGTVAVALGTGLVGAYGYQDASQVYAKESAKTGNSVEADGEADTETQELRERAEEILGDSDVGADGGLYKDESVYVKADSSGKVKETTVTEWLKNPGNGDVPDSTELQDIKNIKGEEAFTRENNGELTWKSEGEDIYYQGTTKKELPVDVNVTYKLNGKEISAEELEGKDGKVEIHIDYVNKAKETVAVQGENVEMYTPFAMVTALMLPTEEYKNVTIDNGRIISDADKDIVIGMAFPGLTENLKLEDMDMDIPESVTIRADVKNASVGPTMTMASADFIDKLGLDSINDFDSLADSLGELDKAAEKLVDGSGELSEGAGTLNSRTSELTSGVNELAEGVNTYTGGVSELAAGSTQLLAGTDALRQGAAQAQGGIAAAAAGADALAAGYAGDGGANPGLVNAANYLYNQLNALSVSLGNQPVSASYTGVDVSGLTAALAEMAAESLPDAAFEEMGMSRADYTASLTTGYYSLLNNQIATLDAQANDAQAQQYARAMDMQAAVGQLAAGAQQLANGVAELQQGTIGLQTGLSQLNDRSGELVQGTNDLYNGAYALQQGAAKLNESSSLLTAGTQKLQSGSAQFADGVSQIADGSNTLAEGMLQFKTDGVDKLTKAFDGDIKNVIERIDAMRSLGQKYTSFAGAKDGAAGSTKFIIETEGIS